jgi:hypothetical protein
MSLDLTKSSAYTDKTPYEIWQQTEGVPIYQGLAIDDLRTVTLEPWKRKGVLGGFINLMGAGRSCDSYACEIPPKGHTLPERYLFEDATVLSPPETVAASLAGLNLLANLSELSASFPQTLIMIRRSFLANNRDTVKRFVRAYSESIREFKTDKEKAIKVYARNLKADGPENS